MRTPFLRVRVRDAPLTQVLVLATGLIQHWFATLAVSPCCFGLVVPKAVAHLGPTRVGRS